MRTCPASDCGTAVDDDSLRFCPDCGGDLSPTVDPLAAPTLELSLGERILQDVAPASNALPEVGPLSSAVPTTAPHLAPSSRNPQTPHVLGRSPTSSTPEVAGQPTSHGRPWIRGPLDPIPPEPLRASGALSVDGGAASLGFSALPAPPQLPDFMRSIESAAHAAVAPRARMRAFPQIGEQFGILIDQRPELRVGASGSLFVRLERQPTPEELEIHLHWEVDIDGTRVVRTTSLIWHADDWDQDATLGLDPKRSGEARLTRLSLALVRKSDPTKHLVLTVRDVPIVFRIQEARPASVVNHFNVTGNANALSVRTDAAHQDGSTPASELAHRQLQPYDLVPESRLDWWSKRRHTLAHAYGARALLSWCTATGERRNLLIASQPSRFQFGRQKNSNHFVLRWLPCRPGVDLDNEELTRTLSREHLSIEITSTQVSLRRISVNTSWARSSSSVHLRAATSGTTFERLRQEFVVLQRSETLALGGKKADGSDGLQLRLTPLANPTFCAVLVERVNNTSNLSYLGITGATRLDPRAPFDGLPKGLTVECVDGNLELQGPPTIQLAALEIEFTACDEDAFLE